MTDENYDFVTRMMEAFQRFGKAEWRKQSMWGIKASEVRVLLCIIDNARKNKTGATVSEISKRLLVTSPTVTQMANSLIAQGYIEREADQNDRRIFYLKLTEKGDEIAQKLKERYQSFFAGLIEHLGHEQSENLIQILDQVFQYTDQAQKEYKDDL
ncbi:MarR family winged helix-turn-helix transcriptional regulator [Paenibacillus radicis (ex Gao et al. 2016)]|uniref:Transcriptional regulator n=1 Tax=Paenibacillus radicis (ex Gao et al. 2016) TaxID=1737354 RepID=A0A917LSW8_9BACL|nr:MarR family transcriptional regulator [Paenibacillus radicis (ex Gao et al. 2016)]GGG54922.1 transcriptional regulator [Paenibacillus radicis (ex Gao et al. 2016)]